MADQPNIIFVFSDQQRYDSVACNGNPIVKTPNLDALAAEGATFDNAFSSCPICSPYRGQVMTGKYSHANGCMDNECALHQDQATLPLTLGAAGYRTAYVGKWHLGYGPYTEDKRYGFDYMAAYNCNHNHNDLTYHENEDGPFPFDKWGPTGETDLALRFIEDHQKESSDDPFCVVMSWGPPHWTFDKNQTYSAYPEQFNTYRPEDIELPPSVPRQMAHFARQEFADYYGCVSGLDHEVGQIMAFLKENGLEKNTILCYSSDHGDHLGGHGYGKPPDNWLHHSKRASKGTPYNESIHIPFIMRYPDKMAGGQRVRIMFNSVDVMPTLLGLAGVELPDEIQGQDLSHAVLGGEGPEPESVYLQILGPGWPHRGDWVGFWRGVRTDRYVYARWVDGRVWLFDRDNDPFEMTNLAGSAEHAEIRQQLELRLQKWIKDTGDPFDTGERDTATGMLKLEREFTHEKYRGER